MKLTKPRKKKLPKAEIIVYGKDYLNQVEEMLYSMRIGIGPKERKRYVDLLVQSMKEITQENMTLH